MIAWQTARNWCWALAFSAIAGAALAQAPAKQAFEPSVGQAGKDVVWVPTPKQLVDKMLDMAAVTPRDYLIDLGSGDGRTVITAAKRGVRALGIEYNPDMVELSRRNAAAAGVGDKATFLKADIFQSDFSRATVITLFLLTDLNIKLRPTILTLKPGTRIVSNTFRMGDWEPDETAEVGCESFCTALLWIVPARVEGTWKTAQGELTFRQTYQLVSGMLKSGGAATAISDGKLHGDQISFSAGGSQYHGRVSGDAIEGTVKSAGKNSVWKASR